MIHLQEPVNDWLQAIERLPDGIALKAMDNVQTFAEVKAINPTIKTVLRHWYDPDQIFGGTFEQNKARARTFFNTFVDGTFAQYAQHADYVLEFNEYIAGSHNQQEKTDRITWARAAAEVWRDEFRTRPGHGHIRLILCATAVGNSIPWEYAQIATQYDCALSYHPYTHWTRNALRASPLVTSAMMQNQAGREYSMNMAAALVNRPARAAENTPVRSEGDWQYLSGRWTTMDADFRSRGYFVDWFFGECGPFESAVTGWRSPSCLNANVNDYITAVRLWLRDVKTTPAWAQGRVKGMALFTTGGGSQWQGFETRQPELNQLADMVNVEWIMEDTNMTWNKLVYLVPQNTTPEQYDQVKGIAFPTRSEIAFSANSAFSRPSDVGTHRVIMYNVGAWGGQAAIENWMVQNGYNYPSPTIIEYRDF